jgi:predicted AAA+ superfamily ATPase
MWINRDISNTLQKNRDLVQILIGPRQCGKTSLFLHLDKTFIEVSFDDLDQRNLAQTDPKLFLSVYKGEKLFIDEVQLAPEIFYSIKREIDLWKRTNLGKHRDTLFRLTGSNLILMDRAVKESLAGRASFFELNTLSVAEIKESITLSVLEILFRGGWPELYTQPDLSVKKYLDDYLSRYIEKDIVLSAGIQKSAEFLRFCKILAGRTGQMVSLTEIGSDVGVSSGTIREWLSILQTMKVIVLVEPFFTNLTKRLMKSPKVYFLDTGLACRLQGWSESLPILNSPQMGGLFETLVFAEIYKTIINFELGWKIYYWRSRAGEEVDFLIEKDNKQFLFVEVKKTAQSVPDISKYPEIKKVFKAAVPHCILCHMEGDRIFNSQVPIILLRDYLLAQASS